MHTVLFAAAYIFHMPAQILKMELDCFLEGIPCCIGTDYYVLILDGLHFPAPLNFYYEWLYIKIISVRMSGKKAEHPMEALP